MAEEHPEEVASAKLGQFLNVAVQMAEAVSRLRQQSTHRAAVAAQTERRALYVTQRVMFSRADEPQWLASATADDLTKSWAAAAGWADTDIHAARAANKVEGKLRTLDPQLMARFDAARAAGIDRVPAMHSANNQTAAATHTAAATPTAASPRLSAARGVQAARPDLARAAARTQPSPTNKKSARRTMSDGRDHPADIAAASHPRKFVAVTASTPSKKDITLSAPTAAGRGRTLSH